MASESIPPLEVTIRPDNFKYAENPFALEEEWLRAFDLQAEIDRKARYERIFSCNGKILVY